jgi:hypothetical protein
MDRDEAQAARDEMQGVGYDCVELLNVEHRS